MAAKRKERRGSERRRCRVRIKFWNDEIEATGFTADISSRGLFVETSKTLSVGTRLHLELELETGSFSAEAVVARALNAPRTAQPVVQAGLGLRLLGITEASMRSATVYFWPGVCWSVAALILASLPQVTSRSTTTPKIYHKCHPPGPICRLPDRGRRV